MRKRWNNVPESCRIRSYRIIEMYVCVTALGGFYVVEFAATNREPISLASHLACARQNCKQQQASEGGSLSETAIAIVQAVVKRGVVGGEIGAGGCRFPLWWEKPGQ